MKFSLVLLGLLTLFACGNDLQQSKSKEIEDAHLINEEPIDSATVFIQDSLIYSVMAIFLDSLPGRGSDSNIVMPYPHIPKFSKIPFEYRPRDPEIQYLEIMDRSRRDNFMGFGVSRFEGNIQDSIYLKEQIEKSADKKWLSKNFRGLEYDDAMLMQYEHEESFDWDAFQDDGFGCFVTYGLPLFDEKQEKCIIYIGSSCHGTIGGGSSYFLEKKSGVWYIVGMNQEWMS